MISSEEEGMQEKGKVEPCLPYLAGWSPFTNHHRPPSVHWITDFFFFFYKKIGLERSTALLPLSPLRPSHPLIYLLSNSEANTEHAKRICLSHCNYSFTQTSPCLASISASDAYLTLHNCGQATSASPLLISNTKRFL